MTDKLGQLNKVLPGSCCPIIYDMNNSAAVPATGFVSPLSIACPECGTEISVSEQPAICDLLTCALCAVEFEVVGLDPIDLALAPEIEEDWGE
jgi:alpha-aminoadipate/glutamate carrier protein LysW